MAAEVTGEHVKLVENISDFSASFRSAPGDGPSTLRPQSSFTRFYPTQSTRQRPQEDHRPPPRRAGRRTGQCVASKLPCATDFATPSACKTFEIVHSIELQPEPLMITKEERVTVLDVLKTVVAAWNGPCPSNAWDFSGYLEDWEKDYDRGKAAKEELSAYDALYRVARAQSDEDRIYMKVGTRSK